MSEHHFIPEKLLVVTTNPATTDSFFVAYFQAARKFREMTPTDQLAWVRSFRESVLSRNTTAVLWKHPKRFLSRRMTSFRRAVSEFYRSGCVFPPSGNEGGSDTAADGAHDKTRVLCTTVKPEDIDTHFSEPTTWKDADTWIGRTGSLFLSRLRDTEIRAKRTFPPEQKKKLVDRFVGILVRLLRTTDEPILREWLVEEPYATDISSVADQSDVWTPHLEHAVMLVDRETFDRIGSTPSQTATGTYIVLAASPGHNGAPHFDSVGTFRRLGESCKITRVFHAYDPIISELSAVVAQQKE